MMSLPFGLFTQVSGSGPLGPLVQSARDRQIFFELSVVRIFEIGTFRQCSVVFVGINFRLYKY